MALRGLVAAVTAQASAANTSSDVTVRTLAVPASWLDAGSHFRYDFGGLGNVAGSGTGTLTLWIAVNGTKIVTVVGAFIGATSNGPIEAVGSITFRTAGASGSVIARMRATFVSPQAGQFDEVPAIPTVATAIDTTQPITISFGMTWSVASTTNTATFDHGAIEQIA